MDAEREEIERRIRTLIDHAWDGEVTSQGINSWLDNFNGQFLGREAESLIAIFSLSRFLYFSKRMIREMLRSLFRDQFRAPLIQRIRRNFNNTRDEIFLQQAFQLELAGTRFIGVGNPSESGAHLLYYFRQVNRLDKNLFIDITDAFKPIIERRSGGVSRIRYSARAAGVERFVFFDDLVGSGTQVSQYLGQKISRIRADNPNIELKYLCLFGTTEGMAKLNQPYLFDGHASCLFELDESYKAFHTNSRNFSTCPTWFRKSDFELVARGYGKRLQPAQEAGYKEGQLMIGFSHNTPDNTLPIYWDEGRREHWYPVFIRFDKNYG